MLKKSLQNIFVIYFHIYVEILACNTHLRFTQYGHLIQRIHSSDVVDTNKNYINNKSKILKDNSLATRQIKIIIIK